MESTALYLIIIVVFSLLLTLPLLFLVLRLLKTLENQTINQRDEVNLLISNHQGHLEVVSNQVTETILKSTTSLAELTDKVIGMLGTKDPIAFQQVQAMNSVSTNRQEPVDNSDHGETLQWLDDQQLDEREKEMYRGFNEL